jgi:hypothetical protein
MWPQFAARNCGLIVVSQGTPAMLAAFTKANPKPYLVVGDPARHLYHEFGLERTSLTEFFRPSVIWKYIKILCRYRKLSLLYRGEDYTQLGGDFVIRTGEIGFAYPSQTSTDRPSPELLLEELVRLTR